MQRKVNSKVMLVVAAIIVAIGAGYGGYYYGSEQGRKETKDELAKQAEHYEIEIDTLNTMSDGSAESYRDLYSQYESLQAEYQRLYNGFQEYASNPQVIYQQPSSFSCTSSNYGGYSTYTTCN